MLLLISRYFRLLLLFSRYLADTSLFFRCLEVAGRLDLADSDSRWADGI